jgi:DNA-binding NarL/FixJ family response regulator
VLNLIDGGLSNRAIAQKLHIEVPTVKNHVHSILQKLNVTSRALAANELRLEGPDEAVGYRVVVRRRRAS